MAFLGNLLTFGMQAIPANKLGRRLVLAFLLATVPVGSGYSTSLDDPATWLAYSDTVGSLIGRQYLDSALVQLPALLARAGLAAEKLDTAFERQTRLTFYFDFDPKYYTKREAQLLPAIDRMVETGETGSTAHVKAAIEISEIYRLGNRLKEATDLLKKVQSTVESLKSIEPSTYFNWHLSQVSLLEDMCKYSEAESLLDRAVEFARGHEGMKAEYLRGLSVLGRIQFERGDYAAAELNLRQALFDMEAIHPVNRMDCISTISTLITMLAHTSRNDYGGIMKLRMLKYAQAEADIAPSVLSSALMSAGVVMRRTGRYVEAEIYFGLARKVDQETFGVIHPSTGVDILRMGVLYWGTKRLGEARVLIDSSIAIFQRTLPPDHLEFASAYMFLASTLDYAGMGDSAGVLYRAAIPIRNRLLGPSHPRSLDLAEFYAGYLYETGKHKEAMSEYSTTFNHKLNDYLKNAAALEVTEGALYLTDVRESLDSYLQSYLSLDKPGDTETLRAAEMIFKYKGLVQHELIFEAEAEKSQLQNAPLGWDRQINDINEAMIRLRFEDPTFKRFELVRQLDSLQCLRRLLMLQRQRNNVDIRRKGLVDDVNVENIIAQIPDSTTFVEYYDYLHYFPIVKDSCEQRYVAVALDKSGIRAIRCTASGKLDDSLTFVGKELLSRSGASAQDNERITVILKSLYGKFWEPIESVVANTRLVIVAPDHLLATLPFHAFMDRQNKFLIERYAFSYVSSGRDLLTIKSRLKSNDGLLAIGDPDYDAAASARFAVLTGRQSEVKLAHMSSRSDFRNVEYECQPYIKTNVSRIEGTKTEIETVTSRWSIRYPGSFLRFSGIAASEDVCKSYIGRYRVTHFATHGYYLPQDCSLVKTSSAYWENLVDKKMDALLNSGLLLAGSNLHGEGAAQYGIDDGILTAREVSDLDLDGVDLVVLSSCESAQGVPRLGQGHWGIKQSFWGSGAKSVVSAFWVIPDALTAEYMEKLYSDLNTPLPVLLRKLAMDEISAYRRAGQFPTPFYWGGFHNFGDWRTTIGGN